MACLKCGQETEHTFCDECIKGMEKYPIKPGIIVQLPKERKIRRAQTHRTTMINIENTVKYQKTVIRWLVSLLTLTVFLLMITAFVLVNTLKEADAKPVGKNYTTATKPAEETTQETEMFHVEQ